MPVSLHTYFFQHFKTPVTIWWFFCNYTNEHNLKSLRVQETFIIAPHFYPWRMTPRRSGCLTRNYPRASMSTPSGSAGSRGDALKHHGSVLIAFIKRSVINLPAIRHHPRLKHGPPVKRLVLGASTSSVVTSENCIYYLFPPYCHFFLALHATWDLNLKCQPLADTSHIKPKTPEETKTPFVSNEKQTFKKHVDEVLPSSFPICLRCRVSKSYCLMLTLIAASKLIIVGAKRA